MANFIQNNKKLEDEYFKRMLKIRDSNMNGRVDIMNFPGKQIFKLYQEPNSGNNNFNEEAVHTIHESNSLNTVFFSKENINLLQDIIRHQVYLQTNKKHIIGRQSDIQLKLIMRSIYFQYSKNLQYDIKKQIRRLNELVVQECIPKIITGIEQYLTYKKDVSGLSVPLERPKYLSSAGTKTLQPNIW